MGLVGPNIQSVGTNYMRPERTKMGLEGANTGDRGTNVGP